MNTENTEPIPEITEKPIESINQNTEDVKSVIEEKKTEKKPRKELSQESKQKRAEVLKRARDAKAQKMQVKKQADDKKSEPVHVEVPNVIPKESKEAKQKQKEEHILQLVERKLEEYKQQRIMEKKSSSLRNFF
jgi:hypothetical protein